MLGSIRWSIVILAGNYQLSVIAVIPTASSLISGMDDKQMAQRLDIRDLSHNSTPYVNDLL